MLQHRNRLIQKVAQSAGAWILMVATLVNTIKVDHQPKIVLRNVVPVYAQVNPVNDWARKDSETETVHMPGKFDIGLRINAIAGRK